jgi:dihydrofolate reductase
VTRRLIVQQFVTLDGYAAGLDGSIDFIGPAASDPARDPRHVLEMEQDTLQLLGSADTLLLGRKTYEMFIGYWPDVGTDKEPIADQLNATPKLVFSGTLGRAPWGKWEEATIIRGDAVEHVRKLKSEPGKNLILWGSLSLAQALGTAGLIDEYQLRVCPAVLCEGRTVWAKSLGPADLELLDVKSYGSGIAQLRYGTRKS